jgi:hypothetical protein
MLPRFAILFSAAVSGLKDAMWTGIEEVVDDTI